jgi:hypothetical protein
VLRQVLEASVVLRMTAESKEKSIKDLQSFLSGFEINLGVESESIRLKYFDCILLYFRISEYSRLLESHRATDWKFKFAKNGVSTYSRTVEVSHILTLHYYEPVDFF